MPEKPEAQVMADRLHQYLANYWITAMIEVTPLTDSSNLQYFPLLTSNELQMKTLQITRVCSHGKKVIFQLRCDKLAPEQNTFYLITNLAMTGRWIFNPLTHTRYILNLTNTITNANGEVQESCGQIYFDDSRGFGSLVLVQGEQELRAQLANFGPDLLNDNITDEQWLQIMSNPQIQKWKLSKLLLEQKFFSGVGNYIRAEALYYAKLAPSLLVSQLTVAAKLTLFHAIVGVIRHSYACGGFTIERFLDPTGQMGRYEAVVYGKKFDPYGNPVLAEKKNKEQTMWWVPAVQMLSV